jgi:CheY-like chemotaxis protein
MSLETSPDHVASSRDASETTERPQDALEQIATGGAVHDLYNLLAVVIGVCEALADDAGQRPEQRELARVGVLAADRAAKLVATLRAAPGADAPTPSASVTDLATRRPLRLATVADGPPADDTARRVLIVEDDPDLLLLLTAAFVREGFKTYAANNGRKGLELLRTLKPDLMITDIVMPEMEGIGTMLEARRHAPGIKVIAISGGGQYGRSQSFLEWASELGADEILAKPFRVSTLITAARVVLDRPPTAPDRPPAFEPNATPFTKLAIGR